MKIDLNKDFEEQYKNELWKGFTARELGYGVVALLVAGGIAFSVLSFSIRLPQPPNASIMVVSIAFKYTLAFASLSALVVTVR